MEFVKAYEGKFGPNTRTLFGATAWDAYLLFARAVPDALKVGTPGTSAFRTAIRDAMERQTDVFGAAGIYNMTPTNHNGTDSRSLVLITIKDGAWKLME